MQKRRTFTLIEVLVTISIIAILAGLLMPAIGKAREKAKVVQTRGQINALLMAIKMYESTYGYLPVAGAETPLDSSEYNKLIDILQGANPRGLTMLDVQDNTPGVYQDAWHKIPRETKYNFKVAVDTDYSGIIAEDTTNGPYEDVNASVAIWSNGKNGTNDKGEWDLKNKKDDINSWDN
jgi:prepilin-type N-terminal cleavage/methylation domain-containing protein